MWATADTLIEFPISFMVDEDFVIPSSASASVRDLQGVVVLPHSPLDVTSTSTVLQIPAEATAIPPGRDFTTLFVNVTFIAEGRIHQQQHNIQLIPFIPLTTGPADVRQILGLPASELDDSAIRVHPAYFRLQARVQDFDTALNSGTFLSLQANRAVALEAAIELIPSLALRVAQKVKAEDQEISRFSAIDWTALALSLETELEEIVGEITGEAVSVSTVNHFVWSFPTDPITGG